MDTRCHVDSVLIEVNRRVEMYERARVDMTTNQADKQKIWEVMKSCFSENSSTFESDTKIVPGVELSYRL